jgi:putative transposase
LIEDEVSRVTFLREHMGRGKKYQPEQVVNLLRQIEVAVANGKTTALACKEAGIVAQTYFRWPKEYGGLQVDQAKPLKELEQSALRKNASSSFKASLIQVRFGRRLTF